MTILTNYTNFPGRVSCSTLLKGQRNKLFYIILIIITLHAQICNAAQWLCRYDVNYTTGSAFESNLNRVFSSLVQDASQAAGFNTSVYGRSPNRIYGLLQCRGDTTADQCYDCSQKANTALQQNCGNANGGLLWSDLCFMRYENSSFIGQLDTVDGFNLFNPNNVSSPDVFNTAVWSLLTNLSAEATSRSNLYASGTTTDSLFRKVNGLVQCWRDISSDDCTTCLSDALNTILASSSETQGAQGRRGSCIVRYELYTFFDSTVLPPPPAEAPVPTNTPVADTRRNQTRSSSNNTQNNKSSNKIPIILGVAGGLLLVLLVCLSATGRILKSVLFPRPSEGICIKLLFANLWVGSDKVRSIVRKYNRVTVEGSDHMYASRMFF